MSRASGVSDTAQRNRDNVPDLLRAMAAKPSVPDGKICNRKTTRNILERLTVA